MSDTRIERDSMGELQVPVDALYGAQTQRAVDNFPISGKPMPAQFIRALILAKAAAAKANVELNQLSAAQGKAIVDAAQGLLEGDFMQHFPVDVFQTGSGTSSNMNANEVIATLASRLLGEPVNPTITSTAARAATTSSRPPSTSAPPWPCTNNCCRRCCTWCRSSTKPCKCITTSKPAART
jgi:fumarate hydratase class II